jgi:hypothetical protein
LFKNNNIISTILVRHDITPFLAQKKRARARFFISAKLSGGKVYKPLNYKL